MCDCGMCISDLIGGIQASKCKTSLTQHPFFPVWRFEKLIGIVKPHLSPRVPRRPKLQPELQLPQGGGVNGFDHVLVEPRLVERRLSYSWPHPVKVTPSDCFSYQTSTLAIMQFLVGPLGRRSACGARAELLVSSSFSREGTLTPTV
jgi:hypothetical protein